MEDNIKYKHYKLLLAMLKAFIYDEKPDVSSDVNWKLLFELAHIHSVDAIVGYMVKKHNLSQDREVVSNARQICMASIVLYSKRAALMEQLKAKMNAAGIKHILFKGYIIKNFYPVPELRSYGDVDFVIKSEDRKKLHQMMLEDDFTVKADWEPVYSYKKDIEYYEAHTELIELNFTDKADLLSYFKQMWNYIVKTDEYSYEFKPEYHLIYLLMHIAKHMYGSGAGIRMYLDIALFIKHYENNFDWDFVVSEMKGLHLDSFLYSILSVVKEWFGIDVPIAFAEPSAALKEKLFEYTFEAGVFGNVNRENVSNTLRKEVALDKDKSRVFIIFERLFPKAETIEKRYTYLEGRHWLLPIAWVHRLFISKGTWKEHSHEAGMILSSDMDDINTINKLHKDIGL